MKKISLLATSVAIALTGCGGGSGGSGDDNVARQGVVLTGFDGYFKNAVVFIDNNQNGSWEPSTDSFLGLTNSKGQLDVGETKPEGTLAIQTLTPGGAAQGKLIAIDSEQYAGIYTVDMDLPGQPMEHELVFRAPNSSNVISPITDLVAIEVSKGKTIEQAEAAVAEALTGDASGDIDLYSDYVEGAKAGSKLHKTAQILTETKAANPSTYQDAATEIAKEADKAVEAIAQSNPELLDEDSFKPVVPVDTDGNVTEIPSGEIENPSYKTTVNDDVYDAVQEALDDVELELGMQGASDYLVQLDLKGLFEDKDVEEIDLGLIKVDDSALTGSNIKAVYDYDNNKLNIGVSPSDKITKAGEFEIIVMIGNSDDTNYTPAYFTLEVDEGDVTEPTYSDDALAGLQDGVDLWELIEGKDLGEGYTVDFTNLFVGDNLTLTFSSNATTNGLIFDNMGSGVIGVQGKPVRSAEDDDTDYTIKLTATDEFGLSTTVELELPDVQQAATPEPGPTPGIEGIDRLQNQFLYFADIGGHNVVWCDAVYFDSFSKNIYWSVRDENNHQKECPTLDNDTSLAELKNAGLIEEGGTYTITGNNSQFNIHYIEETDSEDSGSSVRAEYTLKAKSIYEGDDLNHYYLNYKEFEENKLELDENFALYLNGQAIEEEILFQQISTSMNNPNWVTRIAHSENSDGSIRGFDVSAIMQEFKRNPNPTGNNSESHYSAVEIQISGDNGITCDEFLDIYPAGNMEIHEQGGNVDVYQPHYQNGAVEHTSGNGCYIRLHPQAGQPINSPADPFSMAEIEPGRYTLEVLPKDGVNAERILFSFYK
ncbi:acid phosphatase [Vibrio sinaloensis]|uniref:acid phosphatase n=1 Tax=Photobacterium sp. (strain ATCC 43367) TaxID=379097 RepID=UPI000AB3D77E|nr:acid phosphatase [Vibrio sinaloensis]